MCFNPCFSGCWSSTIISETVVLRVSSFNPVGTYGMTGTINIWGVNADYSDVLGVPAAQYLSVNAKGESTVVPWLEWLLLKGRSFVARGHVYNPVSNVHSRTGFGLMKKKKTRISWQMPAEHSGLRDNNWITRAIRGQDGGVGIRPRLENVFISIFKGIT